MHLTGALFPRPAGRVSGYLHNWVRTPGGFQASPPLMLEDGCAAGELR